MSDCREGRMPRDGHFSKVFPQQLMVSNMRKLWRKIDEQEVALLVLLLTAIGLAGVPEHQPQESIRQLSRQVILQLLGQGLINVSLSYGFFWRGKESVWHGLSKKWA